MEIINFILFIIISIFYLSLVKVEKKNQLYEFLLFSLIIGIFFNYEGHTSDITRYVMLPQQMHNLSFIEIFRKDDLLLQLLAKIVSYITTEPRFFLIVVCIGYMLVFRKVLDVVLYNTSYHKKTIISWASSLLLIYSFLNINALRYGFATVFYLWFVLEYFINNDKRFLFCVWLTPFIHFSYWFLVPLPFLSIFLRERLALAIVIMIVTFLFSSATISTNINNFVSYYFSESIADHTSLYASEEGLDYMNERYSTDFTERSDRGKIASALFPVKNYIIGSAILMISILGFKKIKTKGYECQLIVLILLAFSFANIGSSVSNGDRFYHLATAIAVFISFFLLFNNKQKTIEINQFSFFVVLSKLIMLTAIIYGLLGLYAGRYFLTL